MLRRVFQIGRVPRTRVGSPTTTARQPPVNLQGNRSPAATRQLPVNLQSLAARDSALLQHQRHMTSFPAPDYDKFYVVRFFLAKFSKTPVSISLREASKTFPRFDLNEVFYYLLRKKRGGDKDFNLGFALQLLDECHKEKMPVSIKSICLLLTTSARLVDSDCFCVTWEIYKDMYGPGDYMTWVVAHDAFEVLRYSALSEKQMKDLYKAFDHEDISARITRACPHPRL